MSLYVNGKSLPMSSKLVVADGTEITEVYANGTLVWKYAPVTQHQVQPTGTQPQPQPVVTKPPLTASQIAGINYNHNDSPEPDYQDIQDKDQIVDLPDETDVE